jgi:predicted Zn-dependent protease
MLRKILGLRHAAAALAAALLVAACQSAPVTGRQQLIVVSDDEASDLGAQAFQEILAESTISNDAEMNAMVKRVGKRIAAASGQDYDWEFVVIDDPEPNAFCLPGGKVAVHTGLFKVAKNEAQLAAVIGHEVAHATARHSAERMSQQMVLQYGLQAAGATSEFAAQNVELLAQAATLGVILPFSRDQEAEADEIGLIYMARAGYDPRAAIDLWRNMEAYTGPGGPEFLSTHPATGNRIAELEAAMPRALEIYEAKS